MRKIIYLFVALALLSITNISLAEGTGKFYRFDISKLNGEWKQSSPMVLRGEAIIDSSAKEARATLYSFTGEELVSTNFNLPINSNSITIDVPYYELGKEIKIISNNTSKAELLVVDISPYAKTCEDGTCQEHESFYTCPTDCKSGSQDRYCDSVKDDICDPDCNPARLDADCLEGGEAFVPKPAVDTSVSKLKDTSTVEAVKIDTEKEKVNTGKTPNMFLAIGFGIVILIVLIGLVMARMKKKDDQV